MDYLSTKQAADKWGISERRVRFLCQENKIPGVNQIGKSWMIPLSSKKPIDGRYKESKKVNKQEDYHFPLLIHSIDYVKADYLDENCQKLLKAQILYTKGRYVESYRICENLLAKKTTSYIAVGAYATMAFNCIMFGQQEQFRTNVNSIDKYILLDQTHAQDYLMIKVCINFHVGWNADEIYNINVHELSSLGMNYYISMVLMAHVIKYKKFDNSDLIVYESFTEQVDTMGVDITGIMLHGLLGIIYERNNVIDKALYHIEKCYKLAKKHDCLNYVAKYYVSSSTLFKNYLIKTNNADYLTIDDCANRNIKGWQIINDKEHHEYFSKEIDFPSIEYMTLSYYGMSDEEIAKIQNISMYELNKRVHGLYKLLKVNNRNELYSYISNILGS